MNKTTIRPFRIGVIKNNYLRRTVMITMFIPMLLISWLLNLVMFVALLIKSVIYYFQTMLNSYLSLQKSLIELWDKPRLEFLSFDEIVEKLLNEMEEESKEVLLTVEKKEDLIQFHSGVGMHIRNDFKLWHEDNPYTDASDAEGLLHPDQFSMAIIEKLWETLKGDDI